jgi:hypothetical protein
MENLKQQLEKTKKEFEELTPEEGQSPIIILLKKSFWEFHVKAVSSLISTLIQEEEYEHQSNLRNPLINIEDRFVYAKAKQDTIKKLQVIIKELE